MGDVVALPNAIEPTEWFVVFHDRSANRWLSALTPGRFKHVSAFGYCPGVGLWLVYDVQWIGTRVRLADKAGIMAWTHGCAVVKITRADQRMGPTARIGFTCVNAIKHLLRLKCVAATPDALYRHILRNGGVPLDGAARPAQHPTAAG